MTTTAERLTFDGDDVEIVADGYGPLDGPLVVFAHGGGQTRHAWGGTAALLGSLGWHAVTVDLRGHGDSSWSPSGRYEFDDFAADLRLVVSSLGGSAAMVGASLGGMTSLVAIAEAPDPSALAAALILVDVAPAMREEGVNRIKEFMTGRPEGFATLEEAAAAVAAYNPRPRPVNPDGLRKNLRQGDDGRWRWHWDRRVMEDDHPEPRHLRNRDRVEAGARSLRMPTLLVRGKMSDVLDEEGARHFQGLVPHAELVDVGGAGHMIAGDRNDAFNDAVVDFLRRTHPPREV